MSFSICAIYCTLSSFCAIYCTLSIGEDFSKFRRFNQKINIDGIDEKDINGKSEIQIDNNGAIFEIKKKVSNVTIES